MRRKGKPATPKVQENKRASLVIQLKPQDKSTGASKWNGLAILHAEHEVTVDERKKSLISNVPILTNGVTEADLMDALFPLSFAQDDIIIKQGESDTRLYFVESGSVVITRPSRGKSKHELSSTRDEYEYIGEFPFVMHGDAQRTANVVATRETRCFYMELEKCNVLLISVHRLLRNRFLMREQGVLDNLNVFSALNPKQRGRMLDLTTLTDYSNGEYICRQGDLDDQYFVIVEVRRCIPLLLMHQKGEAKISIMNNGVEVELVRKTPFQGFGEMGLFGKPRTAGRTRTTPLQLYPDPLDVIALGPVACIVMNRDSFVKAQNSLLDGEVESMLATNLTNEWEMMRQIENLHENPQVVAYLTRFIRRFKRSQNAKFNGKTLYSDMFRRIFHNPKLALEFPSISNKIDWFDATSATKLIRYEVKRLMTQDPKNSHTLSPDELAFLGHLTDMTSLLDKFRVNDAPNTSEQKYYMATQLTKIMEFVSVKEGNYIFKQNVVEGKAYVVLSGVVNVVLEDFNAPVSLRNSAPLNIIASLTAGDSFGELSLVTNMARSASAVAGTDTELILIERRNFVKFFASRPGFRIRHYIIERAEFLEKLSFFSKYDHRSCIRVAYDMMEVKFNPRHIFVHEGSHSSAFYVIKEGQVAVYKAKADTPQYSMHVGLIGAKESFGLSAFQPASVEGATFVAATPIIALELVDTKVRRLEAGVQELIRKALHERETWEDKTAQEMLAKGTALLVKTNAPWCPMGDEKTRLEHHVDHIHERQNTSCTRMMYKEYPDMTSRIHDPKTLRTIPIACELPQHDLPQSNNSFGSLMGSFLTKAMQSIAMTSSVSPAPHHRKSIQLKLPPREVISQAEKVKRNQIQVDTENDRSVEEEWDEMNQEDIAHMWQLERRISENLYL